MWGDFLIIDAILIADLGLRLAHADIIEMRTQTFVLCVDEASCTAKLSIDIASACTPKTQWAGTENPFLFLYIRIGDA